MNYHSYFTDGFSNKQLQDRAAHQLPIPFWCSSHYSHCSQKTDRFLSPCSIPNPLEPPQIKNQHHNQQYVHVRWCSCFNVADSNFHVIIITVAIAVIFIIFTTWKGLATTKAHRISLIRTIAKLPRTESQTLQSLYDKGLLERMILI